MAYQHPDVGRAKARTLLSKTGHRAPSGMQTGGKMNADFSQDKRMVDSQLRKAFAQHNQEMHGGKGERLHLADGGLAMGMPPMGRGDRAARGKPKKSGNNVNVIIAGKGAGGPDAPPSVGPHPPVPPAMGMAGGPPPGPPAGPPPGPPPMPPGPPPGLPPGGIGGAPPGLMGGPKPPMPGAGMPPMPGGPPGMPPRPPMPPMRKAGGRTGHDPKIAKEAKEEGESYKEEEAEMRAGLASGGRPNMTAGIGSGAGRLELSKKIKY